MIHCKYCNIARTLSIARCASSKISFIRTRDYRQFVDRRLYKENDCYSRVRKLILIPMSPKDCLLEINYNLYHYFKNFGLSSGN